MLYQNDRVPQAGYLNPAKTPNTNVNVGIPGLGSNSISGGNSGFTWHHMIKETPSGDSLQLTMDDMIEELESLNHMSVSARADLLNLGIRVDQHYFTFNVTQKFDASLTYPKDFMKLLWEGNGGDFLGERASLEGLGFDLMHYREYALGYARSLTDDIDVGGKLKYLSGHQNFYTQASSMGLHTDEESFGWTIDGSMKLRSSGLRTEEDSTPSPRFQAFASGNSGFAVDLGGVYDVNDQLDVSLSVLDLGFIKWTENTRGFVSDDVDFEYHGMDIYTLYGQGDTTKEDVAELMVDSLNSTFDLEEKNDAYTTPLNTRIFIGGNYHLVENGHLGAILRGHIVKGRFRGGFSLSYDHNFGDWFHPTINYSIYNNSFSNVGLGFVLTGGPIQFHLMTDNVLAPLIPHKSRNFHLRTGLNLTFGEREEEQKSVPRF
jgi:hypothetical protein